MPDPMANPEADGAGRKAPRPETVRIPAGHLESGGGRGAERTVAITAFRLGRTPVTNRDYAPFVDSGRVPAPPWWSHPDFSAPLQPVVGVTFGEATAFCDWLSETAGGLWRLPTEAEWEFAACGGLVAPRTAWGEAVPPGEIPEGRIAGPWEAGRGTPNGYGLLDIGTIVHEWCLDWRMAEPTQQEARATLPRRASRGGSWRHRVRWSSPSAAASLPPEYRYSDFGFRVLRELDAATEGRNGR